MKGATGIPRGLVCVVIGLLMEGLVVRHYRIVGAACSEWEELDTGDCPNSGWGK